MWERIKLFWKRVTSQEYLPRYARLAGEIDSYEPQLERRINDTKSQAANWAIQAKELVHKSKKLLEKFKIDEAWKVFHTAKRLEFFGMNDIERLAQARTLVEEVAKLNEWRQKAIHALLGKDQEAIKAAPTPETLIMAAELKDEHYNNEYYKNRLARNIFRMLFTLLFLCIAGILIYACCVTRKYGTDFAAGMNQSGYLTGVLLFGFLGSITSAILFTRYLSKSSRITEIGSSQVITISKIFVGAAFSIFIYLLLKSSVADSIKIFNFAISNPLDYFAIAFVSGYSERLASKAIDAIVGKEKDK